MNRNFIELKTLNFNEHGETVLDFFISNSDFFEDFENVTPDISYIAKTFSNVPEGVPKENKVVLGCFAQEKMVGFAELVKDRHRVGEWLLGLVIVDDSIRKTFFGGRVLQSFYNYIKSAGATCVVGGVIEDNQVANNFWNSIGATATEIVYSQNLNGKKVPTRVMYKELVAK